MKTKSANADIKLLMKDAISEVLEERKDLIRDAVSEAIQEIALVKAIADGKKTARVDKKQILKALSTQP